MVEGAALEMRCTARYRGFESLALRHFFLQKKWRTKPQGFTSLCRQAQLHSKNKVFSSHLHKIPEALLVKTLHFIPLVKTFASLSCEVFSLLRVRMVLFFILRFAYTAANILDFSFCYAILTSERKSSYG